MEDKIKQHLASFDLDIRKSSYRFMDQKVTPDVLSFVSDCIVNLSKAQNESFTKNDIWQSEYFSKNVVLMYNKPAAHNATAVHEYDKFTAQPLKTLAYAQVLREEQRGGSNYYSVQNAEILEYISLSGQNAFNFLKLYLEKVLTDSGFIGRVSEYIDRYHSGLFKPENFNDLKVAFERFMIGNTKINGVVEVRRIFPKVINVLSVANGVPGSRSGRVTEGPYHYSDLMYNSVNFRDIGKLKNVTRQERQQITKSVEEYSDYEMTKAMAAVRNRHFPNSEVRDKFSNGEAKQVHHIFPKSTYPQLKSTLENLILLTAQQHNSLAHPHNNTKYIDPAYQLICLTSKSDSVKQSVITDDGFYSKEGLASVINTGLKLELKPTLSFEDISQRIRLYQQSI